MLHILKLPLPFYNIICSSTIFCFHPFTPVLYISLQYSKNYNFLARGRGEGVICELWYFIVQVYCVACAFENSLYLVHNPAHLSTPSPPKKILSYTWVSLRQNMPNLIFINNRLLDMCDYYKQTVLIHVCLTVKFFSNEINLLINIKGTTYSLLRDWYICVFQQPL